MRSRREIAFRLRQEWANLRLLLAPPRPVLEAQAPLCGLPDPEEVAKVVRFLCSDDASYITGQVISVNGGMI